MIEQLEALKNGWYGSLADLTEELEEYGVEVLEANAEAVSVSYEEDGEDVQTVIRLGGTARTITVDEIEEVWRG